MDDFIDKVAWGLNLVFCNGVGYPKTRWLVFGGARDELAFKDFLRVHQVPTRVWYSAYGGLTALNIAAERADPRRPPRRSERRRRASLGAVAVTARARRRPGALRARLRRPEVGGVPAALVEDGAAARALARRRRAARSRRADARPERAALNVAFTSSGLERLGLARRRRWRSSRTSSSPG